MNFRALIGAICFSIASTIHTPAAPASLDSPDYRKYAPDRNVDILNVVIDITPDFTNETISATTTLTFKPIAKSIREWKLDAEELRITEITGSAKIAAFNSDDKKLTITFADDLPIDREQSVKIVYTAAPKKGLYFRTPKQGYKSGDTHLFTQGEDMDARFWFPTHDYPNEKFTSQIICHVPEGMVAFANGRKVSEEQNSSTGLVTFDWKQEKPHTSYLVCLVAGYFKGVEDTHRNVPLAFYTVPSESAVAANSFAPTKEAMEFFEKEIGVPYPWDKYYQVCVTDFMFGGMENTTLTTLTEGTLFSKDSENIHSSEGLVAHELAHQWFGDLVTCKDWSHAWLNEGFATYYAHLFDAHKNGRESMLYDLYQTARNITQRDAASDTKGLAHRRYDDSMEIFSGGIYPKGGWVLHMLRGQLGEDLYRRVIKTYLERNAYKTVETHDLSAVVEELSGRSFDQFFDQWIFRPHFPELNVSYAWDEALKTAKLNIKQTQPLTNDIGLFNFPLKIRFKVGDENIDREIHVKEKAEDFSFKFEKAPSVVRLDPDTILLARTTFQPPRAMTLAQLQDKNDVIGRVLAIQTLRSDSSDENIKRLKEILNNDSFVGVRQEAVSALRGIHTSAALEALLASTKQSDARVRIRVMDAIGSFYDEKAFAAHQSALKSEKNPDILVESIQALAASPNKEATELLLQYANTNSFHQLVASRAISALRNRRDPTVIPALIDIVKKRWDEFPTSVIVTSLNTLAELGADDEAQRPVVREFLVAHVNEPRERIQVAAIRGLGALRDEKAISVLEGFASSAKETPTRNPAEFAINAIRSGRRAGNEAQALRTEVMDLKKENRELRDELKSLSKKVDALIKTPADTAKQKSKSKTTQSKRPAK
ncbi:MAG TPA: M1 family aminopeptidase [Verrucomicrobiae bacterium]|nr:M1 family aminopeptidase [Verrucomicrobiae bacterium]